MQQRPDIKIINRTIPWILTQKSHQNTINAIQMLQYFHNPQQIQLNGKKKYTRQPPILKDPHQAKYIFFDLKDEYHMYMEIMMRYVTK